MPNFKSYANKYSHNSKPKTKPDNFVIKYDPVQIYNDVYKQTGNINPLELSFTVTRFTSGIQVDEPTKITVPLNIN